MTFYGVSKNYDKQISQLQQQIQTIKSTTSSSNPVQQLPQLPDINIKTSGKFIAQTIISAQYSARAISTYLHRQYYLPLFKNTSNIRQVYKQIPDTVSQAKNTLARQFTFKQRFIATSLVSTIVCARSINSANMNPLIAIARSSISFFALSLLLLPQTTPKYLSLLSSTL